MAPSVIHTLAKRMARPATCVSQCIHRTKVNLCGSSERTQALDTVDSGLETSGTKVLIG